ncbi:MAG: 16S rRNA (cytosine(1402)-N(4))-methyltransferase RsmH [Actinomycetota bacterium]|nr:16S rRNA (cytosine(1402)-N(4))-methyltransferase RsmH [Actinomycetota bacterium]
MDEGDAHVPVLVEAAIDWLGPALEGGGRLVDCTLGAGGHAMAFLEAMPDVTLIGIDRDEEALEVARTRLERFGDRVRLVKANFADLETVLGPEHGEVAAILYDLGVSSMQLDQPWRGFGYRTGFPLDMRMNKGDQVTAAEIVNKYSERRISEIIARYGEERFSRRIARAIVSRRQREPFSDAGDLAEVVKAAIPAATRRTGPHPARRTFQALRIETNNELTSLETSLPKAVDALKPGGRIAVISYHSLEDRVVKTIFQSLARGCVCPPDAPVCTCGYEPKVAVLTRRPLRPSDEEVARNRRADSAKMRVAEKLPEAA